MAAFYVDAVPARRRVRWQHSNLLEAVAIEADFHKIGCRIEGIAPIVEAVRADLDHLNHIRKRLLQRSKNTDQMELPFS